MPSKSSFVRGFKTKAEKLAEKCRVDLGLSKVNPLDAFTLAEHMNIPIFSVNDVFSGNETHSHCKQLNDPSNFNALWMHNEDGHKIIIHNTSHTPYRQQSNLMHELAHIMLDHEISETQSRLSLKFGIPYINKAQEDEAKFLGACLQITKSAALMVITKGWTDEQTSTHFSASLEMVKYRLNLHKYAERFKFYK